MTPNAMDYAKVKTYYECMENEDILPVPEKSKWYETIPNLPHLLITLI